MGIYKRAKRKVKRVLFSKSQEMDPDMRDYVQEVADVTDWTYEEALENMEIVRKQLGVPYKEYFNEGYYGLTRSGQERRAECYVRRSKNEKRIFERTADNAGRTRDEIEDELAFLNQQTGPDYQVDIRTYSKYGMYEMSRDEALELVQLLAKAERKAKKLRTGLRKAERGEITYQELQPKINSLYKLVRSTITPSLAESAVRYVDDVIPDMDDERIARNIATDMEVARLLFGFGRREYVMYHLDRFRVPEKSTFLSDKERSRVASAINTARTFDILSNKYLLYETMPELFGRELAAIYTKDDFEIFEAFVKKHRSFVCKPFSGSIGRGIRLVTVKCRFSSLMMKMQFENLLRKNRIFLMEEQIISCNELGAFNADSLNTVRVITYYDAENDTVTPLGGFFRTGRPGSFVDNAGAGGVYASVDCRTGKLDSDGADESGHTYYEHPYSHIAYRDFQLPEWDQALELVGKACRIIGERSFIGWDIALNSEHRWVIVEGNGRPQFVHQGPLLAGSRKLVKEVTGV